MRELEELKRLWNNMDKTKFNKAKAEAEQEFIAEKKLELPGANAKTFIEDIIGQMPFVLGLAIDRNKMVRKARQVGSINDVVSDIRNGIPLVLVKLEMAKKLFETGKLRPFLGFNPDSTLELISFYKEYSQLQTEEQAERFLQESRNMMKKLNLQK